MITMDVFKNSAFSAISLTTAIQDLKFVPSYLTSLNLATKKPIRTTGFAIEKRADSQKLIPITERGSPRARVKRDRRTIRNYETVRTAETDTIRSHELQNIRAFGSETELEAVSTEIARRMADLRADLALTMEYRNLGMVQGLVLDADGVGVLANWFTEFNITPPTEIGFNWAARTGVHAFIKQNVVRPILRALGGRAPMGMSIRALCGDTFYDALIENPEVRATYLNWLAASELRGDVGKAFEVFNFGGVDWVNYRGTDDNSTVAIAVDKCRIFPMGVGDMFQEMLSPGENLDFVNTLGMEVYAGLYPDFTGRNEYAEMDVNNYSMHVCTTPEALLSGRQGA
jgi:Phage major capsid protein E